MCSTELGYAATSRPTQCAAMLLPATRPAARSLGRSAHVAAYHPPIVVRVCCAMSGTELGVSRVRSL
eukprot:1278873-Rhodomonas_salina.1